MDRYPGSIPAGIAMMHPAYMGASAVPLNGMKKALYILMNSAVYSAIPVLCFALMDMFILPPGAEESLSATCAGTVKGCRPVSDTVPTGL